MFLGVWFGLVLCMHLRSCFCESLCTQYNAFYCRSFATKSDYHSPGSKLQEFKLEMKDRRT